jgi:hypothetical protein
MAAALPMECPGGGPSALAWIQRVAGWLAANYAKHREKLAALLPPVRWRGLDGDDRWHARELWNGTNIAVGHADNLMAPLREAVKRHLPAAFSSELHRHCLPTPAKAAPELAAGAWREVARLAELATAERSDDEPRVQAIQQRDLPPGDLPPGDLPPGEWSKPMSKTEMMVALRIDGRKRFNTFANGRLLQAGNRQTWRLRLDRLSENEKKRLRN